jgi:hypothetical protein
MKFFLILAALIFSPPSFAAHCSMESLLKYDDSGMVTFPVSAGWAMGTRSMEYHNSPEACFAEALKWKELMEADPTVSTLVSSIKVSYGTGKLIEIKEFKITQTSSKALNDQPRDNQKEVPIKKTINDKEINTFWYPRVGVPAEPSEKPIKERVPK